MFANTLLERAAMSVSIVYSHESRRDLDRIWEWIAIENEEPGAASKTVESILNRIDGLAEFPLSTPALNSICRIHSDWRLVQVKGYLAFFRIVDGTLYVDRVLSAKSDYLKTLFNLDDGIDAYR